MEDLFEDLCDSPKRRPTRGPRHPTSPEGGARSAPAAPLLRARHGGDKVMRTARSRGVAYDMADSAQAYDFSNSDFGELASLFGKTEGDDSAQNASALYDDLVFEPEALADLDSNDQEAASRSNSNNLALRRRPSDDASSGRFEDHSKYDDAPGDFAGQSYDRSAPSDRSTSPNASLATSVPSWADAFSSPEGARRRALSPVLFPARTSSEASAEQSLTTSSSLASDAQKTWARQRAAQTRSSLSSTTTTKSGAGAAKNKNSDHDNNDQSSSSLASAVDQLRKRGGDPHNAGSYWPPVKSSAGEDAQTLWTKHKFAQHQRRGAPDSSISTSFAGSSSSSSPPPATTYAEKTSERHRQGDDESDGSLSRPSSPTSQSKALMTSTSTALSEKSSEEGSSSGVDGSTTAASQQQQQQPAMMVSATSARISDERERNREHARNMRQRKKEALCDLQAKVDMLMTRLAERERESRCELERSLDLGRARRETLARFFEYRSRDERDERKWRELISDDFGLVQPRTPHRSYPPSEVTSSYRVAHGPRGIVLDTAACGVFFRSIGLRAATVDTVLGPAARTPKYQFTAQLASIDNGADDEEVAQLTAYACDVIGMHWRMATTDAVAFGATQEAAEQGLLIAKFVPNSSKVREMEFVFDVINAMQEVEAALPLPWLATVPNTLNDSTFESHYEARVVTTATAPYVILNVNVAWLDLCGFASKADTVGKTLACIQGEQTDMAVVEKLTNEIKNGSPADAVLLNYTKAGEPFLGYSRVFPLFRDAKSTQPSHFLCILCKIHDAASTANKGFDDKTGGHLVVDAKDQPMALSSDREMGTQLEKTNLPCKLNLGALASTMAPPRLSPDTLTRRSAC